MMRLLQKQNIFVFVLLLGCSALGYWSIGYSIERGGVFVLLSVLAALSILFFLLMRFSISLKGIFILGFLIRLLFLFALPQLSQDFYRFLWDGNIQLLGINPYSATPNQLLGTVEFPLFDVLYTNMGSLSAENYTSYPPLSQWIFKSVLFFNQESLFNATILLRIYQLFFEVMVFIFGVLLLRSIQRSEQLIAWYFLNPLIIIELSGNLHGESLMLALCLAGFYFLIRKNLFFGALFISLSIAAKLIPLLLIPAFFYYLGWKRMLIFGGSVLIFSLLLCVPFFDSSNVLNFFQTVYLWFNTFEFNASSYYIIREIGYEVKGYNIIRRLGKITPFIVLGSVLCFSLLRKNNSIESALKRMLLILSVYFFMATTVHPWYVVTLVMLGLLSGYVYPMIWSATVFLSYSAYANDGFKEYPVLIALEYLPVYGCFFYELLRGPLLHHFQKINFISGQSSPVSTG